MLDSSIPKLFEPDETVHRTLALSQDNSKTVAERLEIIKPLLIYIQYFTEEIAQRVVNSLRSICKDMLNESLAIPTELIAISKTLHNFPPASLIYDYLLAPMFQKIRGFEFPECAMAAGVFHIDSDDVGRLLKVAIKKLKGTHIETIAALFLIRQMSGDLMMNPDEAPENLFENVANLFTSESQAVQMAAHKAGRLLIDSQVFCNQKSLKIVISQFSNYSNKTLFFRLLERFLDEEDQPPNLVQPIFTFVKENLAKEDLQPQLIHILASLNPLFLRSIFGDALAVCESLLQAARIESIPAIGHFLSVNNEANKDAVAAFSQKHIREFIEFLNAENPTKQKLELIEVIGDFIEVKANAELMQAILGVVRMAFGKTTGTIPIYLSSAILNLIPSIDDQIANELFNLIYAVVKTEVDERNINSLMQVMAKLIKKCAIDEDEVKRLANDLMKGEISLLGGIEPCYYFDGDTRIFHLLSAIVRKHEGMSHDICTQMINWIGEAPFYLLPTILEPIRYSLGVLSPEEQMHLKECLETALSLMAIEDEDTMASIETVLEAIGEQ